jgi:hypothetical protein
VPRAGLYAAIRGLEINRVRIVPAPQPKASVVPERAAKAHSGRWTRPPELESVETALSSTAQDEQDYAETPDRPLRRRPRDSSDTPRARRELDPGENCLDYGGTLRLVGEVVSHIRDMITARQKLIKVARPVQPSQPGKRRRPHMP